MAISAELEIPSGSTSLEKATPIHLENLTIRRSGNAVIQGLSHNFEQATITAIVGASGVGKSSLALVLVSLLKPAEGKVLVGERELNEFSLESRRRKIVLIEQQPHVFRGTLRQNLEIAGELEDQAMLSALALVGLDTELAARGLLEINLSEDAGNVSGGQAQRIAIARGLLAGAEVLILDEPTSGLDRENALALMQILSELRATGMTVIVITHDPEIAALCDSALDLTQFAAQ